MPLHLRPVGPLPAAVYWRRRGVVLAVLVLLLLLLTRCGGDDGGGRLAQAPAPSASPAVPSAAPSAGATPAGVADCPDSALRVSSSARAGRYRVGQRPVLRLAVRNVGEVPCRRDLGQGAVELLVFSGMDRIWSSDDCAPGGPAGPQVLQPAELREITLTWSARRSAKGCPGGGAAITPGTYRVVGRVGQVLTLGQTFVLVP